MWLWILSALIIILAWVAYFMLGFQLVPTWVPIAVTGAVVLFVIGVIVFRRIRAARAARALEKAIAQQAQEQALAAKPERVAEIQELHRQFQQAIASLKGSKLGGGKRGSDALYVLPWYVIVGPPGAGKTTALRHSGLVFPYLDPSGGGVRGVGGTRNCDWWFTNEAILLDTAGRYTTEADDHDEWMAFLGELLKYRPSMPLNGVIVAVSINEIADANDDQIQQVARRVRERIDEMQDTLKETLPVYVLFTKADLIAGFVEYFGDLKKSERGQPWGATVPLDADKSNPGKIFENEFEILLDKVHTRSLKRMSGERSREAKEKVYQFPLEFRMIKRNLADFLQAAFAPGAGKSRPVLRGFYFTSGTQEGKPFDRAVAAMGRGFGLRVAEPEASPEKTESKSYFLRDVFEKIIFPDQTLAVRSEAEIRRVRNRSLAIAAVAAAFGLMLIGLSGYRFYNNRVLNAQTERIATEADKVDWNRGDIPPVEKVDKLNALREHVELLDRYKQDGEPASLGFPMYRGNKLFPKVVDQYRSILVKGFVQPTRETLEDKLRHPTRVNFLEDYNTLKTYLLLSDKDEYKKHLKEEDLERWEIGRLTQVWAENLRRNNGDISEADLKEKLRPHVTTYLDLLKRGELKGENLDEGLVESSREALRRLGIEKWLYERVVTSLIDQKYDEAGLPTRDNLVYPPITLGDIFADRAEVLDKIRSYRKDREGKWFEVRGPFTYKGHEQVLKSLSDDSKDLEREQWVLPFSIEERLRGDKIKQALRRVREDYDNNYIQEWTDFFKDIVVEIPANNRAAIGEFKVLSTPDWPYQRLLRALQENTQFDEMRETNAAMEAATEDGGIIDQAKLKGQRWLENKTRVRQIDKLVGGGGQADTRDKVQERFKSMVHFGVPAPQPPPKGDAPPPPPQPVELGNYIAKIQDLAGEMGTVEDGPPSADTKKATEKFEDAVKTTEGLILKMDDKGQELMSPLLMNPLRQAYKAVVRHAGGAASGLWEVQVYPTYEKKIKDRYPFNLAATKDASFQDAVAFFKPKDGILWGFYEQNLKTFHAKVGHKFVPQAHLDVDANGNKPAKPSTPFNAKMYVCLERADEITDALFPEGAGDKPKVEFQINLKTVSPIVSEVTFEIDGQKRVYKNEKEFWYAFTWPGPKPTGAKLRVRGAGGLDEEIVREGPWGIFRLFEAGTTTAEKDKDDTFTVTWQLTAPPVTVTMEVKPIRANHPFPSSFFRATNCPPSIGDKFGKGKGS